MFIYARVAQWWSIALPRRGSRVRIPSRALKKRSFLIAFFAHVFPHKKATAYAVARKRKKNENLFKRNIALLMYTLYKENVSRMCFVFEVFVNIFRGSGDSFRAP